MQNVFFFVKLQQTASTVAYVQREKVMCTVSYRTRQIGCLGFAMSLDLRRLINCD